MQTVHEARAALDCGATAIGLLVGVTHRAEDAIDAAEAEAIIRALPDSAAPVMVTHLTRAEAVADMAGRIGARTVQVHGAMPLPDLLRLRALTPGMTLIRAVHVTGPDAVDDARALAGLADALVLDTRTEDRLGGTGRTHDWSISRRIVEAVAPMPVYLAGGLSPGNVAAAIARVRPSGVDVNSGVEHPDGRKDPARMAAFVAAALAAFGSAGTG
ncbi:MAG: phosphoribosylanthranilate isomerase [Acetobacteraceae bacterium]